MLKITNSELQTFLEMQQSFYGHPDAKDRAKKIISQFETVDEAAQHFRILKSEDGKIIAGLGISGDIYLQNFYFDSAESFQQLLKETLETEPKDFRVYINAHPQSKRFNISESLKQVGFEEKTDLSMSKPLRGQVIQETHADKTGEWQAWSEELDGAFQAAYERRASTLSPAWDIVKYVAGGEFCKSLWFMSNKGEIIGINRSSDARNQHIYTITALEVDDILAALSFAEEKVSQQNTDAVLHIHTNPSLEAVLSSLGYSGVSSEKYFDYMTT